MDDKKLVCPQCGGWEISVNLLACVTFLPDGEISVDKSDLSFDEHAEATCTLCDHSGSLYKFVKDEETVSQKIIFTLNCGNAAFEDDFLGAVQAAFAEAAVMITKAIDCNKTNQEGLVAFVRDVNGNACGRIDVVFE